MSLTAKGLRFAYPGGAQIIDGLDLHVPPGASAAITAPSGTGKSTLLALLGGLRRPTDGTVMIDEDALHLRPTVAWVFQAMHLLGRRTAVENAALGALARGASRTEAFSAAEEELARFGVVHLAGRQQRTLSGGESQRVALARAAVADPLVVLADEPTANLDRHNADHVIDVLMTGFPRAALVVATHDAAVAAAVGVAYELVDGRLTVSSRPRVLGQ